MNGATQAGRRAAAEVIAGTAPVISTHIFCKLFSQPVLCSPQTWPVHLNTGAVLLHARCPTLCPTNYQYN